MANAKCYSHQVNPEIENDYHVFMANHVYGFCTETVLINFIKITTEFTKSEVEFSLLYLRVTISIIMIRLGYVFCWVFRVGF